MQRPRFPSPQPELFGPQPPVFARLPESVRRELVAHLCALLAETARPRRTPQTRRPPHVE